MSKSSLPLKYRPTNLKQVVGQDAAVKELNGMLKKGIPQFVLLTGPSGCGKTTCARIIANHLECGDVDFTEIDCADLRGVDTIRDIKRQARLYPRAGKTRVWLIDEAHKLTTDAQAAFLKTLEEPPKHAYFIFATTDPQKLHSTIKNRSTPIQLKPVRDTSIRKLIGSVLEKEGQELSDEIVDKIVEQSRNSPRAALVLLEKVLTLDDDEDKLEAVVSSDSEATAFQLAQLLFDQRAKWPTVKAVISKLDEQDWEGIRYLVLSYATKVILGNGPPPLLGRAATVLDRFQYNWFDSKKAGLVLACWQVFHK